MSFKCIDLGVIRKLKEVYPNVVFGPLSRALELDTETYVEYANKDGLVVASDHDDYEIINSMSTNPIAIGPNNAPQYGTERTTKNGVVAFPLIACDRIKDNIMFGDTSNDPMIRRGWRRDVWTEEGGFDDITRPRERAFPVEPIYQIDIISNRRVEVDEITRELLMYLYLSPNISVLYSEGTPSQFEELYPLLVIDEDETSDVETFEDKGIIYRKTITAQLKDAKLIFQKRVPLIEEIPLHVETFNDDWLVKEDK